MHPAPPDLNLDRMFNYHPPFGTQPTRYSQIRAKAKELAELLIECCPASPERTLAIRNIHAAMMQANASIAIHEQPLKDDVQDPR